MKDSETARPSAFNTGFYRKNDDSNEGCWSKITENRINTTPDGAINEQTGSDLISKSLKSPKVSDQYP